MDEVKRLAEVEIKLAFLEQTVHELNASILHQQKMIETLQNELQRSQRLVQQMAETQDEDGSDQPPPHY